MKSQTYANESEILWAVTQGHYHLTAWLLQHDYQVDALEEDGGGRTLLHWAVQENRTSVVHLLLARGANPEALDMHFITPFAQAAAEGRLRLLKILHHYGANPNGVTPIYVPLHIAVACAHWKCVRYLLQRGADINAANKTGNTALVSAVHHRHHGLASYLIHHGARRDVRDENGALLWELRDEGKTPKTTRDVEREGGLTLWEMAEENHDAQMLRILNGR